MGTDGQEVHEAKLVICLQVSLGNPELIRSPFSGSSGRSLVRQLGPLERGFQGLHHPEWRVSSGHGYFLSSYVAMCGMSALVLPTPTPILVG